MSTILSLLPLVFIWLPVVHGQPGPGPSCLCFEPQGTEDELYNPTVITNAGDGSGRLFVGEQRGYIWIFLQGIRNPAPFLNLTGEDIYVPVFSGYGLMSFTFHPEFATNGQIYVYWFSMENSVLYFRVTEFLLDIAEGIIDPGTARDLFRIEWVELDFPHTGGMLLFGDDGYLYIGVGDGGCCYDPLGSSQNKTTHYGAVHRIDVDSQTGEFPYGIPPDNPFLDEPDTLPSIFAYGVRQPWKSSKDPGDRITGEGRGRIFFGDVGDNDFEEVSLLQSGGNFGWPIWEGPLCLEEENCDSIDHIGPVTFYNRTMGICVIYGGIYRGCLNPDLDGWMIMVDYASKEFFGAVEDGPGNWPTKIIQTCTECPPGLTNNKDVFIISMGSDETGEYYFGGVSSIDPLQPGGTVYRIVDPNNPGTPCTGA